MSKKNTKQIEAAKTSETNRLDKLNTYQRNWYDRAVEEIQKKYDNFEQPTYKDIKSKINKARRQNKIYETKDRQSVFRYIATWRYTADMIATYSGRTGQVMDREGNTDTRNIRICVNDIYLYIRETEECIHLINHEWFNTELCKWEVIKYFCQYGDLNSGIVYMPFMKGLKYAVAYKRNLPPEETKYQIVTASKRERCLYVQSKMKVSGRHYSYNYIREHLSEL